jgi:hypothetical protein
MNFTKLVFPAALAGAILMNAAAQAQSTDATQKMKAMIDDWAGEMKQIAGSGHGEKRRNDLKARTDKLNADVQGKPCTFSDRGFYDNHVENAAKGMSVTVKANFECNRENKTEAKISFIDVATSMYQDDIAYNAAIVSKVAITKLISDWAAEEKTAINSIKDQSARASKVTEISDTYRAKFQNVACHLNYPLGFWPAAMEAARPLPIKLNATESCEGNRLRVTFVATLDPKAEATATLLSKPTIDPKDTTWAGASAEMFPPAKNFTDDSSRASYASKFGSNGTYINRLNTVACSDLNAVQNGLAAKARDLQSVFSFRDISVKCAGTHLSVSVHVEALKKK